MSSSPFFSRQPILPGLVSFCVAATVSCMTYFGLGAATGMSDAGRSAFTLFMRGSGEGLKWLPFFLPFALPGFMLARLTLELLKARSFIAFIIGGAFSGLFYPIFSILIGLATFSYRPSFSAIDLSSWLPLVIAGAMGGAVYYAVRFAVFLDPRPTDPGKSR